MTNKTEKQFFDTFGIEERELDYPDNFTYYPEITDHILLELILIIMRHEDLFGYSTNIQELKDNTLKQLIETYNKFSTCVTYDGEYQQIFGGIFVGFVICGENDPFVCTLYVHILTMLSS